ncbi:DoxX family protein [Geotalea toluenoxydans]|uniref:DoxX family protein n=1 Tax=Geotalea toluenoxydans TaxID=421624 RepID=UPI000AEEEB90|nr:DoxX family protein [Geotalea toluenoxydans]
MRPFMSDYIPHCYALMRIVAGFLFLWHGAQKLFAIPSPMPAGVPSFITYVAGPIELFCGILVMIGLFTHWAAFIASGQMAFATGSAMERRRCCRFRMKANWRHCIVLSSSS